MTTYYLDTNSGFFYKKIIAVANSEDTCSIEGWSSKAGTNNTSGVTSNTITIEGRGYDVSKVTSISKTDFIQSTDLVKTTSGGIIFPSQYEIRAFTKANFTIPRSVNTIAQDAFSACTNLTSIIYSGRLGNNAFGTTVNSPLIQYAEPGKTTFVKYFHRGSTATSYTIPSGITTINPSAFDESKLTSIIYSGELTGKISTSGTSPLIQYQDSETKIIKKYFQRSSSETIFKSSDYPLVNSIISEAFTSVSNLVKIVINSNITIAKDAFFNCSSLKGIVISSPCTLQQSIITGSTLDYVLISSTSPVTMGNSNPPSDSSPIFPSSILASTNYCVVSNENRTNVDTLFGTSNIVYIEDATIPPATDTPRRVYIRPATYNSIKTTLVGESNDIASIQTSIDFDNQVDSDSASASAAALTASTQLNSANANTSEREAKLLKAIQAKVRAINAAITDITGEQAINNRKINYFGQDKYVNMYVNRIGLILYYIVFILLALSFYYNRESYSIVMIVISLIVFALLPFVIKYITRFAYEQFLGLLKVFYKGNVLYL